MTRATNVSGIRFGRLIGLNRAPNDATGKINWNWRCDCGTEKTMLSTNVRSGKIQSCGCLQKEARIVHGKCNTATYSAWKGMKCRVAGTTKLSRKYYVPKGITVCDRWSDSFEGFLLDMGECPEGLTLDRIDNDGNYEPGNCRWATRTEQSANTRRTHHVTFAGERMCLAHACRAAGVRYRTVMRRLKRGVSPQDALGFS